MGNIAGRSPGLHFQHPCAVDALPVRKPPSSGKNRQIPGGSPDESGMPRPSCPRRAFKRPRSFTHETAVFHPRDRGLLPKRPRSFLRRVPMRRIRPGLRACCNEGDGQTKGMGDAEGIAPPLRVQDAARRPYSHADTRAVKGATRTKPKLPTSVLTSSAETSVELRKSTGCVPCAAKTMRSVK